MRIYVGNLPYSITDQQLRALFEGRKTTVTSADIVTDAATGRSKGYGFVEIGDEVQAMRAINELHETDLEGRQIVVNKARERAPRRQGTGRNRDW